MANNDSARPSSGTPDSGFPDSGLPDFNLIETFRYEPGRGFLRLEQHLQRLQSSAQELGFSFNAQAIRTQLQLYANHDQNLRIRLCLSADGSSGITATPFQALPPQGLWKLAIARTRQNSTAPLLRHKTTKRAIYEAARAEYTAGQADEVLLLNEKDQLCEGTITTLFADTGEGLLLTPPLTCGLLDGVLRKTLLQQGKAREEILTEQHLKQAHRLYVGNSLRGLIGAELI